MKVKENGNIDHGVPNDSFKVVIKVTGENGKGSYEGDIMLEIDKTYTFYSEAALDQFVEVIIEDITNLEFWDDCNFEEDVIEHPMHSEGGTEFYMDFYLLGHGSIQWVELTVIESMGMGDSFPVWED
jgi:hypothetical protein